MIRQPPSSTRTATLFPSTTAFRSPRAERCNLFQRTPQWVLPRENPAYTEEEKASFRDPAVLDALVQRYRTTTFEGYATAVIDVDSPQMAAIEQLCRDNLLTVRDPDLRQKLTPDYRPACKRLVISDRFYDAVQQPTADLVTSPIEQIGRAHV